MFMPMTSMAGQPLYVGVITTSTCSLFHRTSRTIPRSITDKTGTSGSFTSSRIDQISFLCTASVIIYLDLCFLNSLSPFHIRVGPLHELKFGKDESKMFAVISRFATRMHMFFFRNG